MNQVITIFILLSMGCLQAQSPYALDAKKEAVLLGTGLGLYSFAWAYQEEVDVLDFEQLSSISRENISSFDRSAVMNYSMAARNASDVFLGIANAAPLALFLLKNTKNDRGKIGLMYLETMALTLAATGMTKRLALRSRPFVYNPEVPTADKQTLNARFSFFSGHTSTAAAACFFSASVWSDYHPDSKWKPVIWATAATLPAVTGYLRVRAGKHFPTDVLTGYVIGAGIGYLVPLLHKNPIYDHKMNLSLAPGFMALTWRID